MKVPASAVKQLLSIAAIVGILLVAGQVMVENTTNISLVQTSASWVRRKYGADVPPPLPQPDWSSIPPAHLKFTSGTRSGPNWIVVTTIKYPTEALERLVGLENWNVVVVADTKTPSDWALDGAVYLGLEEQAVLDYRIHKLLPLRHYARKNIGYLYAIQHGAQTIYETDDDNLLIAAGLGEAFDLRSPPVEMLCYATAEEGVPGRTAVNPYIHFGQPSIWPRGLPLEAVAKNAPEQHYVQGLLVKALVQQGLAEGDPDVDAIFRLTRVSSGKLIRVKFDNQAPPVALPRGLAAPFNSQNTLFHEEALWGLLIPITTTFRICDIWRGYWMQRLLWDLGGSLSFFPASVLQDRNVHDYMMDYLDEAGMYTNTSQLIALLGEWNADEQPHFFDRVVRLSYEMASQGFWGFKEVDLAVAWLSDLISVGYTPPVPVAKEANNLSPHKRKLPACSLRSSYLDGSNTTQQEDTCQVANVNKKAL